MLGIGIAKGMIVTLKHLFRPKITIEYPEQKPYIPDRYRGGEFEWYEERCTGCSICAKVCPNGVINVVTHELDDGSRYIDRYDMDLMICLFCGFCAEACPFGAIFVGSNYEGIASYNRPAIFYDKQKLYATLERTRRAAMQPERKQENLIWSDPVALGFIKETEAKAHPNGAKPDVQNEPSTAAAEESSSLEESRR